MRTGIAHLPLHYGTAPRWLFDRMVQLARQVSLVVVEEYGPHQMLQRLADPFWFHAFGCLLGFDWHSSGLTTTVCGALKEGLRGLEHDTGLLVAGGKGRTSRKTPSEIEAFADRLGFQPAPLVYASRLAAKVDSAAVQDGYQVYHHSFFFTTDGAWAVVQQGMNEGNGWARRYHWLSDAVADFVCEPHAAVCSDHRGQALNMVALESDDARAASVALTQERPEAVVKDYQRILALPRRHHLAEGDIRPENLHKVLLSTYERQPQDYEALLGLEGVGPKAVRALALIAELLYGVQASLRDPARFAYAHGGKDGHPYPVDRRTYDQSIEVLRTAVAKAKLGQREKLEALRRLSSL
ncbi:MAG: DUF763 domain-containing protein [Dehalococcoidia bacterium]